MLSVPLAERFMHDAPNASLIEYPIAKTPTSQLLSRDVDFTIHIEAPSNPIEFPYVSLGQIYPVFYVSEHHPLAKAKNVTLEQCLESRFVDLTLDIRSNYGLQHPVDTYLVKLYKLARFHKRIKVSDLEHFDVLPRRVAIGLFEVSMKMALVVKATLLRGI